MLSIKTRTLNSLKFTIFQITFCSGLLVFIFTILYYHSNSYHTPYVIHYIRDPPPVFHCQPHTWFVIIYFALYVQLCMLTNNVTALIVRSTEYCWLGHRYRTTWMNCSACLAFLSLVNSVLRKHLWQSSENWKQKAKWTN